jgi:tetratricopeptide (TPR) repeat protein|eukprot:gnl/Ergobibamus_cyprinoides/505.p1 GENE.gnl/Ergobibamus_cyprinoides/505~~gnl/Ergobibamus_cyprinoides/505.p1  ORF type:complete len:282 (+),score=58.75 gnl/Ergobibamus_cyprinoides/505:37-882(+)
MPCLDDVPFDIRVNFYLHNLSDCFTRCSHVTERSELSPFIDYFHLRSAAAAFSPDVARSELARRDHSETFKRGFEVLLSDRTDASDAAALELRDSEPVLDELTALSLAAYFSQRGKTADALISLHRMPPAILAASSEAGQIEVQLLLSLHRGDLAADRVHELERTAPDSPATILAGAQVALAAGDADAALEAYNALSEKFGSTPFLKVSSGVALMAAGQYESALPLLKEANSSQPSDPSALANLVVCLSALGRLQDAETPLTLLRSVCPDHALLRADQLLA